MEPLTLEYVAKIIRYERPDAILPGLGGQTGLNLAMQLDEKGRAEGVRRGDFWAPQLESIDQAEDRELFKELCQRIGEPVLPSDIAHSVEEATECGQRDRLSRGAAARPLPWAAPAAALRTTRRSCEKLADERAEAVAGAPGAGGKEHQGLQRDRIRSDAGSQRHRHHHLQHGKHRPGGRAHRRFHRGVPQSRP